VAFRRKIELFFINIGSSGKYTELSEFGMSDYLIRYVLLNSIIIMGSVILAVFTIDLFRGERYFEVILCCGMIFLAMVSFVLARTKITQTVPASIIMVSYALLCVLLNWTGEAEGANFLFIYMYPSLAIMLLGMRYGMTMSVILGVLISLEMFVPGLAHFNYSFDFSIRMLVNYFLVFAVMTVIESARKTKDRLIETQNRKLQELMEEAWTANRIKTNLLASVSHEIRTPMNAIIGMAELLMRGKLPDESRIYAQDIKQAGTGLISVINDILDFAKIEAGKLEIIPKKYLLASLVNDSISIIRMQFMEKPIRFYTIIDGNLPNGLVGDVTRLRQVFLNLLSNALKYTNKGDVCLSITQEKREGSQIWLKVEVTDTGIGIKPEDQARLFTDYVKADTKRSRTVEGIGLGLVITKRLCMAMGGDITVQSEYDKGSSFTTVIPQGVYQETPFVAVEEPDKKRVLVFEGRACYAESVDWSLENMKVPHVIVRDQDAFVEELFRREWFFVFSGYSLYEKIKPLMERPAEDFPGHKKPPLALMVEWGTETYIPGVRFMSLPMQSLSIANILNGKADSKGYFENVVDPNAVQFTLPRARILVVDDINTNLKVAEGLLAPYRATVETCMGGLEAIELVKHKASEKLDYDLIFMDHMMPDVDGIEATAGIREWEESLREQGIARNAVPIIALTANALSGMKEMFLEKGFNDFLAKPIDVSMLDEILAQWIPNEKKVQGSDPKPAGAAGKQLHNPNNKTPGSTPNSLFSIPGVDTGKGMSMTGETEEFYRNVLALFLRDALERQPRLQTVPETDALRAFITQVHSLKSASKSIGADEFSAAAAALEAAGKSRNMTFIKDNLPGFTKSLAELIENIRAVIEPAQQVQPAQSAVSTPDPQLLNDLERALKSRNAAKIDRILNELKQKRFDPKTGEILEKISNDVLIAEYGNALKSIEEILRSNK
jgi:signal transduction histidine kinase/CheY-like chemotaxis protein/HPt (histidine-containing phosphotransfer) domain-containing protein